MNKKDLVFKADLIYSAVAFIGYFFAPDKASYVNMLALGIMPVLTALNVGISASIYKEKPSAKKHN